jgi:glucokinase
MPRPGSAGRVSGAPALVADIGGTNTRIALARGGTVVADSLRRFRNVNFPDPQAVLHAYLSAAGHPPLSGACAAVAGPVRNGAARLTNREWALDLAALRAIAGPAGPVALLNDLQAQGHALDHLTEPALTGIAEARAEPGGTRLVIGIGTGFNIATVHGQAPDCRVTAAEAGHAALPLATQEDLALARFVTGGTRLAEVEDVLSGRGLARLYGWVSRHAGPPQQAAPEAITALLAQGESPAARAAGEIFARLLGLAARNLAVTLLPTGGIFLCGSVARAMAPHLNDLGFAETFRARGRIPGEIGDFAVSLINDDTAALTGCAAALTGNPERRWPQHL